MYDLVNIFEIFLPQLLLYPNPTDPLNAEAAALQLKNEERYKEKIRLYVIKYAMEDSEKPAATNGGVGAAHNNEKEECKEEDHEMTLEREGSELSETSDIDLVELSDEDNSKA